MAKTTGNQYHLPGALSFDDAEWDDVKAESNLTKHEIAFTDALMSLRDPDRIEIENPQFRDGEFRWKSTGFFTDRMLTVIYTWRESNVRIISARKASRNERRKYRTS